MALQRRQAKRHKSGLEAKARQHVRDGAIHFTIRIRLWAALPFAESQHMPDAESAIVVAQPVVGCARGGGFSSAFSLGDRARHSIPLTECHPTAVSSRPLSAALAATHPIDVLIRAEVDVTPAAERARLW